MDSGDWTVSLGILRGLMEKWGVSSLFHAHDGFIAGRIIRGQDIEGAEKEWKMLFRELTSYEWPESTGL